MSTWFVSCPAHLELTEAERERLASVPRSENAESNPIGHPWCELETGHSGAHHAEVLYAGWQQPPWWLRWDAEARDLLAIQVCEVDSDPIDAVESEPCGLFMDHPGRHGWEFREASDGCPHPDAHSPDVIAAAKDGLGRHVTVVEGRCIGCDQPLVQVHVADRRLGSERPTQSTSWVPYNPGTEATGA